MRLAAAFGRTALRTLVFWALILCFILDGGAADYWISGPHYSFTIDEHGFTKAPSVPFTAHDWLFLAGFMALRGALVVAFIRLRRDKQPLSISTLADR